MVSAGQVSSHLNEIKSISTNVKSEIDGLSSNWMGESYNSIKSKVDSSLEDATSIIESQMNSFIQAINLYEKYIEAKTKLENAQSSYNQLINTKQNTNASSYLGAIETYKSEMNQLKEEIESCLSSITGVISTTSTGATSFSTPSSGSITYQTARYADTTIWYSVIPSGNMPKLAVANDNYDKMTSEKPSSIAQRKGAKLGVNCCITGAGDGILYTDGKLVNNHFTSGEGQTLYMTQDGSLQAITNNRTSIQGILNMNPVWATQGFYTIIKDGKYDDWNTDLAKAKHPRTFIGQDYDGNYIVGVCTGRQQGEAGMTLKEVYDFVTTQVSDNIRILYNADGGGSSAFVYNGEKLNPNTDKSERARPDLIYWT